WLSSHLLLLHLPSHHNSQLTPPEQLSPNKHRTSMPRQSRQAFSPATNASSSTAGSSPPAASTAASTPPAARARSRLIGECWLICRLTRASPGRPRAAIPLPTHRFQHQPLLKGKYPQRQGRLPRLQELSAGTCAWTGL
ncbi:unnamed protein product, partial [Ectocarpus sp. 12 AP-2014]